MGVGSGSKFFSLGASNSDDQNLIVIISTSVVVNQEDKIRPKCV